VSYKGITIEVTKDFSADILLASSDWEDIFKILRKRKRKYYTQKIYPAEILSKITKMEGIH
jgi:hypothetical protein